LHFTKKRLLNTDLLCAQKVKFNFQKSGKKKEKRAHPHTPGRSPPPPPARRARARCKTCAPFFRDFSGGGKKNFRKRGPEPGEISKKFCPKKIPIAFGSNFLAIYKSLICIIFPVNSQKKTFCTREKIFGQNAKKIFKKFLQKHFSKSKKTNVLKGFHLRSNFSKMIPNFSKLKPLETGVNSLFSKNFLKIFLRDPKNFFRPREIFRAREIFRIFEIFGNFISNRFSGNTD